MAHKVDSPLKMEAMGAFDGMTEPTPVATEDLVEVEVEARITWAPEAVAVFLAGEADVQAMLAVAGEAHLFETL